MRIVFVVNSLIYGGAETQVIALSRELAKRKHHVAIYTLRADNPRASQVESAGVRVVVDNKRWKLDLGLLGRIRNFLREFRPDIVHGFLLDGNFHATMAAAYTGIPVLISERGADYRLPSLHRLAVPLSRRLVTALVANSHAGARFAKRLYRLPDSQIHVVWNGVDTVRALPQTPDIGSDLRIHYFGSADVKIAALIAMIRPEKDYVLALRVARELHRRNRDWRVLLVGDCLPQTSRYKDDVLRAFTEMRLDNVAAFAGLRHDVPTLVRASDVLFSTSLHEGFPNVVLEAMVAETPVVTTEFSDIKMILPRTWQVVPTREPGDLADAILRADTERGALAKEQLDWVSRHATMAIAAESLERVYAKYAAAS